MFPTWSLLSEDPSGSNSQSTKDLLCYMTEIQLQALLDATGVPGDTLTTDSTTLPDGRKVSKFDLAAMKLGARVPPHIKPALLKFCKKFVGKDSVFPTEQGAPRILTAFKKKPYRFQLRGDFVMGPQPKPLPTVKDDYYHGKPATRKDLEHFVRTTPVVSKCDHPKCLSRLVIVAKRNPGAPKDSPPTDYRATMNALINKCLKPTARITL